MSRLVFAWRDAARTWDFPEHILYQSFAADWRASGCDGFPGDRSADECFLRWRRAHAGEVESVVAMRRAFDSGEWAFAMAGLR